MRQIDAIPEKGIKIIAHPSRAKKRSYFEHEVPRNKKQETIKIQSLNNY